ncbi:MAG: circularly permuted type 2 ATP-grasp protein, partial [Actinomycetota bacterium]|nr:circularly permuted type 2 ATP-grasp protein [Actinomycetota bacterium]
PAWLGGNVGLVNAFGNGVADDKLVHAHVEDFIRFYLGEEPLVRSVPTHTPCTAAEGLDTIRRLEQLVVKPRHGHGGHGVVIGGAADAEDLQALTRALREHPERYISQPIVSLSRHPTVIDGRLEPRHVDLRPFAFARGPDDIALMPGGLSRVALAANALVVNSSQDGGGKDTWVLG